jgi:hypothetical protein
MLHRPEFGYYDEGCDFAAPAFYAQALAAGDGARLLPPAAFRSKVFPLLEDEVIWARDWVCVGSERQVPGEGDMLPFTIGVHGLHVQRVSGGLEARFNKAQHGGCRVIPTQCQTGTKTRCSFTSCGYSRDRDVIGATELGDGTPEMHQYLGLRPERLVRAQIAQWNSLIFVNLDIGAPPPAETWCSLSAQGFFGQPDLARRFGFWREYDANWKLLGQHLVGGETIAQSLDDGWIVTRTTLPAGSETATATWFFPNLVLIATATETCVVVLQPTAIGRTLCRIGIHGSASTVAWPTTVDRLADAAVREHGMIASWGTGSNPESIGREPPRQRDAAGLWMQQQVARRARTSRAGLNIGTSQTKGA